MQYYMARKSLIVSLMLDVRPRPKNESSITKSKKNAKGFTVCLLPIHQAKSLFFC